MTLQLVVLQARIASFGALYFPIVALLPNMPIQLLPQHSLAAAGVRAVHRFVPALRAMWVQSGADDHVLAPFVRTRNREVVH